jgi:hypothetical protein
MDEHPADDVVSGQAPQPNPGWFRPGDRRINRDGRPKKSWAAFVDRAPQADRLMLLWVPRQELGRCLAGQHTLSVANLPPDYQIVGSRVDADRDAVALVLRSETFPRLAKGAPIPESVPEAAPPADRAPCDDRLAVLLVPKGQLARRLGHRWGFWVANLPPDVEVAACRVDPARHAVVFTLRSASFPLVAAGEVIPAFRPDFRGLKWGQAR